ncbi:hypothetical protein H310_04750 [Aphanomyces invadans]|uniref:Methyltransferase domain-containing protein n=1 Tax=Aphanomyces invadans TaxID=157072 RepID=A0A024UF42_9STRA|nr:hypothetical protein H310_04750 [Aphanomyces invadans]ETW04487.1 hypothetical protein H310_04750 [Aphanomyces invadans]|eukprot:XP_008867443.1 hypothetical protein H310_04750 [Aphanomyces invadans]
MYRGGHLPLYSNDGGTSAADTLRRQFFHGDVPGMQSLIDALPTRTSLCCVNPTSALLRSLQPWLEPVVASAGTVLSIGCGSGLFEMLLARQLEPIKPTHDHIAVFGVDTAPVDVFLRDCFRLVRDDASMVGADDEHHSIRVAALLAVYLRRPSLLVTYLHAYPHVEVIVLLGPRSENPLMDNATAAAVAAWGRGVAEIAANVAPWDVCQVLHKHDA